MAWTGQVLASVDPTGYETQVRSAEASWLTPNPATPSYCHSDNEKFRSNPNCQQSCKNPAASAIAQEIVICAATPDAQRLLLEKRRHCGSH